MELSLVLEKAGSFFTDAQSRASSSAVDSRLSLSDGDPLSRRAIGLMPRSRTYLGSCLFDEAEISGNEPLSGIAEAANIPDQIVVTDSEGEGCVRVVLLSCTAGPYTSVAMSSEDCSTGWITAIMYAGNARVCSSFTAQPFFNNNGVSCFLKTMV